MSAPTHFRRLDRDGREVDTTWVPISRMAFHLLSPIWVRALEKREYSGIWLLLESGQEVLVKRRRPRLVTRPGYHAAIDTLHPRPEAGDAT